MNVVAVRHTGLRCVCVLQRSVQQQYQNYQKRFIFIHQWKSFKRWQDLRRDNKDYKEEQAQIKNAMRISDDLFVSPERPEQGGIFS